MSSASHPLRLALGGLVLCASAALPLTIAACGNSGGGAVKTPASSLDGGGEGGAGPNVFATTPPPSGLPPMASMPPPGVNGSKKAKKKPDASLSACGGASRGSGKDPADVVKKIGDGCAAASKMKPAGALIKNQQADKDTHQESKMRVEANHCYRVYVATDDTVKDLVVVMRDSAGDIVVEAPGPAIPQDGSVCFTTADEVTLLVSVGAGKGTWAAQVWSD